MAGAVNVHSGLGGVVSGAFWLSGNSSGSIFEMAGNGSLELAIFGCRKPGSAFELSSVSGGLAGVRRSLGRPAALAAVHPLQGLQGTLV